MTNIDFVSAISIDVCSNMVAHVSYAAEAVTVKLSDTIRDTGQIPDD